MTPSEARRPITLPLIVLAGPVDATTKIAAAMVAQDFRVFAHQEFGDQLSCLCCAGAGETERQLELLLRDIDNGRGSVPRGVFLVMGETGRALTALATIESHPYFRLRFSPARLVALGDEVADVTLAVDSDVEELLGALAAPASERPPALREKLYRARLGARSR